MKRLLVAGLGIGFVGLMLISGGDRFGVQVAVVGMVLVGVGGLLVWFAIRPWYCQSCGQKLGRGGRPDGGCPRCGSNRVTNSDPFSSDG